MHDLDKFFKAMSDETRLRMVMLLHKRAFCVCELTDILGESQPKISKHLSKLKDMGFVSSERKQKYIYHRFITNNHAISRMIDIITQETDEFASLMKKADACDCVTLPRSATEA